MAENPTLAFLQNALGATGVQEETALLNLLMTRLITGGITVSSGGTVAGSIQGATTLGSALQLLHQGSGTDTSAAATTVDSFGITGLTVKDSLWVLYNLESITQPTANILLYQSTDPLAVVSVSGGAQIAANGTLIGDAKVMARQGSSMNLQAKAEGINSSSARVDAWNNPTYTTLWTSTWTLALRHGGVTSGGMFKYVWSVYKVAGQ